MTCKINGRSIGAANSPYIIAELSANHNGSLEAALLSIKSAKDCGADAVKIQTYTADSMTIDCDFDDFIVKGGMWDGRKLYDLYLEAQTPYEWHAELFEYAKKIGITLFSTPFDESAVDFLEDLNTPAYKVASFELTDHPLLRYIAKTNKPVIMSTGMATESEIDEAVNVLKSSGCRDLILLHCISSYPAPIADSNLVRIGELLERYGVTIGLSDHSLGTTVSIAAVSLGASVIEKHFILSRNIPGPDSAFSIEPNELKSLCLEAKSAWQATKLRAPKEVEGVRDNMTLYRRSIYFVRDKKAGELIESNDVRRIRPGLGLAPKFYDSIIGRKINKDVCRGMPTSWDLFDV